MVNRKSANIIFYLILISIFCLGIFLRIKGYLYNKGFWYNEAALALNVMDRSFSELLQPLDYVQCAPYFFLLISKVMITVFGTSEFVFRFSPLIFGILSVFAFYFLSKEVLNKKYSILIANILFCINYNLIYYCEEFKQYSLEVLITILSILCLSKLNMNLLNNKKCVVFGFLFFVSFLFSMPQIIMLSAFILFAVFDSCKAKQFFILKKTAKQISVILLPFIILLIPYYFSYLAPNKEIMLASTYMWSEKYISLNFNSIKDFVTDFYYFVFYPNHNQYLSLFLTFFGAFHLYKDGRRINVFILLIILIAFVFSILHIYPLYGRIALYIVPLMILIMVKPLDKIGFNKKNLKKTVVFLNMLVALIFCMCTKMYGFKYLKNFNNKLVFSKTFDREFIKLIQEKGCDKDIKIVTFYTNKPAFEYYLRRFKLKADIQYFDKRNLLDNKNIFKNTSAYYWYYEFHWNVNNFDTDYMKEWLKKNYKHNAAILLKAKFDDNVNKYANIYFLKFK